MSEIEEYFLSKISENDCHKVSKYLQIKQWVQLYGNRLLRNSSPNQLYFIEQVILHDECWVEVDSLKGVKLNRSTVGRKLLAESTPSGGDNPLQDIQKYKIACWCCFEGKITEVANLLRDELLENNRYATYGPLVTYWTYCKIDSTSTKKFGNYYTPKYPFRDVPDIENIHYGFESSKRENNVEALNYFWEKLRPELSTSEQNELLIYTAISYHLPFNKANNAEMVEFAMDHLAEYQYHELLQKDLQRNKQYSILHHLSSYLEFDRAKKLYHRLSDISYFDYCTLIYCILFHLSSLPYLPSDTKFYDAGYKMLKALNIPSEVHCDIISSVEVYRQKISPNILPGNISTLSEIISSNLQNYENQTELKKQYNIQLNFNSDVIRNTLEKTEAVPLDQIKLEEAINNFNGDDSSDEEDDVMSYNRDVVLEKLKEFNEKQVGHRDENWDGVDLDSINGYNNFGFLVHAVAIKLFYSSDIQTAYYRTKPSFNVHVEHPNFYEIHLAVDNAAHHIAWFASSLSTKVVTENISDTININHVSFVNAVMANRLRIFFETLENDKKYCLGDLLGRKFFELGNLNTIVQLKPELIPETNFDVSKFQSDFSVQFFSNLRLYNRLEKRKLRIAKYGNLQKNNNTTWKYSETVKVEINNETRQLTRKDEVQFEGHTASYREIYNKLTAQDLEELPTLLSSIFTEGVNQISNITASLHYLLFGVEVIRNPSALIHNMMMLDLIKAGKLTWENALLHREIPMAIHGALVASRIKNSKYNENYMPHKYLYEQKTYKELVGEPEWGKDNYAKAFSLLDKEKDLTIKWLEWKQGTNFLNECLDEKKDLKMEFVGLVFDLLQESCLTWYNIRLSV